MNRSTRAGASRLFQQPVSGDRALLRCSGNQGVEVVTPRRFVERLAVR